MKIHSIASLVFLLIAALSSCKKDHPAVQSCGQDFYYFQDQKQFVYVSMLKITIGFKDTLSFEEMKQITDQYSFIKPLQNNQIMWINKVAMADLDDLSCSRIEEVLSILENDPAINYANSCLVPADNNGFIGIMDGFTVKLQDSTQLQLLEQMAQETNTVILEQDPLFESNVRYVLSATKHSNGNALEMAKVFSETHLFKYAEPNFMLVYEPFWY